MSKKSKVKWAAEAQMIQEKVTAARDTLLAAYKIQEPGEKLLAFRDAQNKVQDIFAYETQKRTKKGSIGALIGGVATPTITGTAIAVFSLPLEPFVFAVGIGGAFVSLLAGGIVGEIFDDKVRDRYKALISPFRPELEVIAQRAEGEEKEILANSRDRIFESPAREQVFGAYPDIRKAFIDSQIEKLKDAAGKSSAPRPRDAGDGLHL